jgi:hypothetical protein
MTKTQETKFITLEENVITETEHLEKEILKIWTLLGERVLLQRKKVLELVEMFKKFQIEKTHLEKGFYLGHGSPPGSGKSTVLLLLVYFARKEGFTVVYIPNGNQSSILNIREKICNTRK